jgi:hypothetical protein
MKSAGGPASAWKAAEQPEHVAPVDEIDGGSSCVDNERPWPMWDYLEELYRSWFKEWVLLTRLDFGLV